MGSLRLQGLWQGLAAVQDASEVCGRLERRLRDWGVFLDRYHSLWFARLRKKKGECGRLSVGFLHPVSSLAKPTKWQEVAVSVRSWLAEEVSKDGREGTTKS